MPNSRNNPWKYLEERFGVTREDLSSFEIFQRSEDYWLISKDGEELVEDLEFETAGFRFLRTTKYGLKPTTYALQFIDDHISRNVVELEEGEVEKMLMRKDMIERDLEKGYVALKYEGDVLGCGFYMNGVVSSRIPKGRSKELFQLLDL